MAIRAVVRFRKELEQLLRRRTQRLRAAVEGRQPGAQLTRNRRYFKKSIATLQELASDVLAERLARRDFEAGVRKKKSWHSKRGKGRGEQKKIVFNTWFDAHFGRGTYIYVFWKQRQCVYVGRTGAAGRRISGHFDRVWFGGVTRVDVYRTSGQRVLSALECLAIHRFQPARNKFRAGRQKYTSKCPLCSVHRHIRQELQSI